MYRIVKKTDSQRGLSVSWITLYPYVSIT